MISREIIDMYIINLEHETTNHPKSFLKFLLCIFLTFTTFFRCPGESLELCNIMRELLHIGAYVDLVQNTLVQAQVNTFFLF